jgi:hypothetical protein
MKNADVFRTIEALNGSKLTIHDSWLTSSLLLAVFVASGGCSGAAGSSPGPAGGEQGAGGSTAVSNTGGTSNTAPTGGATSQTTSVGGMVNTGGANNQGGTSAGPTGGSKAAGGSAATGGSVATGGVMATGGLVATGGVMTTGGSVATGGAKAAGGSATTGGSKATATGGSVATGGKSATGGTQSATGGAATGGATGSATGGTGGFVENSGANCNATSAPLLSAQLKKLPDPFAMHSGTRISTKSEWPCRRAEIKADIEKYEIGPKPDPSTTTVAATLSGSNLSVNVSTSSGSLTIKSTVSGSGSCVVIGMDMNLGYITGCTTLVFSTNDVIPYNNGSGSQNQGDPFYKVYPSLWGKIGNYTAWSWGVSRLIDGIVQLKDQLKVDPTKIATHGCSYAGKMALFAGAFDERVALTVAEESGGGGINAWRASQDFTARTGTNIEKIDNTNYAWFMSSMRTLDPYKLPHDHHELIAMVAPRAIIILGNPEYQWLGDESGYKSTIAALEVFKALGVADHIGYDFTGNHAHCSAPTTQVNSMNTFANRFLKGQNVTTNIAIKPNASGFDLSNDFDWTTPTLQ